MKYFISSTLAILCALSAGMQVLGRVNAGSASDELSTREPQISLGAGVTIPDPVDNELDLSDFADVERREGEAAGLFWPPRRRPVRVVRPVYIRPRPRRRPHRPRRRPNRHINVNGANGGTNIGGNGANGGNIRVGRDVQEKREEEQRRPVRVNVHGANGGFNQGGNGANGGRINVNIGGGRRGGRRGNTNVRGANGGTNYFGNGANGGTIKVN